MTSVLAATNSREAQDTPIRSDVPHGWRGNGLVPDSLISGPGMGNGSDTSFWLVLEPRGRER